MDADGANVCPPLGLSAEGEGVDLLAATVGGGTAMAVTPQVQAQSPRRLRNGKVVPALVPALQVAVPATTPAEPFSPAAPSSPGADPQPTTTPTSAPTTQKSTPPKPAATTSDPAVPTRAQFDALLAQVAAYGKALKASAPVEQPQIHVEMPSASAMIAAASNADAEAAAALDADADADAGAADAATDDEATAATAATDAEDAVAAAATGSDAGSPSPFGLSSEDGEDDVVFVKATGKGKATSSDDDDGVITKANGKGKATSNFTLLSDTDNSLSDSDHQTPAITDAFVASLTPVRLRAQEVLPNLKRHFAKKVKKYGSGIAAVLALDRSNKAQKKRAKHTDNAKKAKRRKIESSAVIAVTSYMTSALKSDADRDASGAALFRFAKKLGKLDQ